MDFAKLKNRNEIKKYDNKGFTLVELIVVLVILSILAAILVPTLLGYIDEAKKKQYIIDARTYMTTIQSCLSERYAYYLASEDSSLDILGNSITRNSDGNIIYYINNKQVKGDPDLTNTAFAQKVMKMAEAEKPYLLLLYALDADLTTVNKSQLHKCFTAYSICYWHDENSVPIFYNFDTNSWEDGNLYTAKFMYRGSDPKPQGVKANTIVSGHKYAGDKIRIFVLYYGGKNYNITTLNQKMQDKMNGN